VAPAAVNSALNTLMLRLLRLPKCTQNYCGIHYFTNSTRLLSNTRWWAVMPCGWGVKAGVVRVWVWSPCYTRAISERFSDKELIIKRYIDSPSLLYFTFTRVPVYRVPVPGTTTDSLPVPLRDRIPLFTDDCWQQQAAVHAARPPTMCSTADICW